MYRVLLVEDSPSILELLVYTFQSSDEFEIVTSTNGSDAYLKVRNQSFDLICTDYQMPMASGLDLVFAMRDHRLNAHTPILFLTGHTKDVQDQLKESPDIRVLGKPFVSQEVLEVAFELIEQGKKKKDEEPLELSAELVEIFTSAVKDTISVMASVKDLSHGKPFYLNHGQKLGTDLTSLINVSSPKLSGYLGLAFPKKTYLALVGQILGNEFDEIIPEIEDAAGEMTQIVYGQVRKQLSEKKGWQFESAFPLVIAADNHSMVMLNQSLPLIIPLHSSVGEFFLQLSIESGL